MCVVQHGTSSMVCVKRSFINKHLILERAMGVYNHGNLGPMKPKEATRQVVATLATIIVPLADAM